MSRVLIFGTGGVGALYGYLLHKGGAEVTAVCRTNYNAVKQNGFLIRSKIFGRAQYNPKVVQAVSEAASPGQYDYIVVCSKAFPGTASLIQPAITSQTTIVLGQNGIAIEDEYHALYPNNTIISGVVYLPVTQVSPGVIEHGPLERFEIGTFPSTAPSAAKDTVHQFSSLITAGGGSCPVYDDIQPRRWVKVAVNAAWNPTTALTLCDDANFLRSSPMAEQTVRKIMQEVGRVAAAAGYPDAITEATIDHDLARPKSRLATGGKEPSMLTDVREGRPMEVEAIVGNTLRIGERFGVSTPYLEMLYTLAKGRNYALAPDEEWRPIARHD